MAELLSPISKSTFFSKYWQNESLVCQSGQATKFLDLMSLEKIEEIFSSRELSRTQLRVVVNDRQINPNLYVDGIEPWSNVSRQMALKYYSEGATLVFNGMQRNFTELARFCGEIGEELTSKIHANVYLTPPSKQGFLAHYDTHDVFVLQLSGSKDWKLYDSNYKLPLESHEYSNEEHFTGNINREFRLMAGQYCYIPRGIVHEAKANNDLSLHITIGIASPLWIDVIKDAIDELAKSNVMLRRVIPDAYASGATSCTTSEIENLIREIRKSGCIERAYDSNLKKFRDRENSNFTGRLLSISKSSNVSSFSEVKRIKPIKYIEVAEEIEIENGDSVLRLPRKTYKSLKKLAKSESVVVEQLGGDLDVQGNIVLVKRLIREEFLTLI
ncbi:cupin domain-containing protein [Roseibium sp. SCPC15]|uniref:JmjC domain-containing protein n=1 Tax=Roseibium sp. SCP15 TaxID=3141376 RepID=UPI00333B465C